MKEHKESTINIFIDKHKVEVTDSSLTGAELKSLGNVTAGYQLWLEVPGGKDIEISDNASVEIKHGMRFFSTKPTIDPGGNRHGVARR